MKLDFFDRFWKEHPALLYGISLFLGCSAAIHFTWALAIPIAAVFTPLFFAGPLLRKKLLLALALLSAGAWYSHSIYPPFESTESKVPVRARFSISSVTAAQSSFGKKWVLRGVLKEASPLDGGPVGRNLPCSLSLPFNNKVHRPPCDRDYRLAGNLVRTAPNRYFLQCPPSTPWIPIENSYSLAEIRYQAKEWLKTQIKNGIGDTRCSGFLAGLATGEFDDPEMQAGFARFGLQHIMAISGFHFAIIAAILNVFLRLVLPPKSSVKLLIALLSGYFLFLGFTPSIMRAFCMSLIGLATLFFRQRNRALNALGASIIMILLIDPAMVGGLGFQFSMLTTASILLFFPAIDRGMKTLFRPRPISVVAKMSLLDQHFYLILMYFRQAVALGLAVNLAALPFSLFAFHQYPVLSVIYNLFFPFLVSISMLLLLTALILWPLPSFIADAVHHLNRALTGWTLDFVYNMPISVDYTLEIINFRAEALSLLLTGLFTLGIGLRKGLTEKESYIML